MDLFDLSAKITLDSSGYEKGLKEASGKTSSFGSKIGGAFKTLGKVTLAGLGAAAAGVAAITKSAVSAYADYEQLVGGVETLFSNLEGTVSAAPQVLENAANAYRTAGLSANQYMETVTSFSAALVSSLEGDYSAAAKVADMAITDMSDNANKMGTSMESIQMAYQGFAKQNYTMLDNLKLGYGGTRQEMERLLADAQEITGVEYDISNLNDVYEAIHVIQGELGITGTTAKEAASTISGSAAMMKSAWANLMTGLADDSADFDTLINNFVSSVGTFADNILPRISTAIGGVGKLIEALAPQIATALPAMLTSALPALLSAASSLVQGFVGAISTSLPVIVEQGVPILMSLVEGILQNLPMLVEAGLQILVQLANGISESLPTLVPVIVDVVLQIVDTLIDNVDLLVEAAVQIIVALAEGLIAAMPKLVEKAPEIILKLVAALIECAPLLLEASVELIKVFGEGIWNTLVEIISSIGSAIYDWLDSNILQPVSNFLDEIWQAISDFFSPLIEFISPILIAIQYLFQTVWAAIQIIVSGAMTAISSTITSIWTSIKDFIDKTILQPIKTAVSNAFNSMVSLVSGPIGRVKSIISSAFNSIKSTIMNVVNSAKNWGHDLVQNFVSGVTTRLSHLAETVTNMADTIRSRLHFSEPDVGPLSDFHTYAPDMMELFAKGIRDNKSMLMDTVDDAFNFEDMIVSPTLGVNASRTRVNGVGSSWMDSVAAKLSELCDDIRSGKVRVYIDGKTLVGYVNDGLGAAKMRYDRTVMA